VPANLAAHALQLPSFTGRTEARLKRHVEGEHGQALHRQARRQAGTEIDRETRTGIAVTTQKGSLLAMPNQLSGIFSSLGEPMPIYKRFKAELNQRFEAADKALRKIKQESRRKDNVVPFNRALNGASRA
jgi:hypothetical protein